MGKQNWSIFEANYTSLLKYISERIVLVKTKPAKFLNRGRAKHFQCNFEL